MDSAGDRPHRRGYNPRARLRLDAHAAAAGFRGARWFLRYRYLAERRSAREIAVEVGGVSESFILRELRAAEVEFRRRGHRHYDERHPNRWTPGGAGLTEPPEGFADWSAYVAARVDRLGRPQATRIAAELGITRWMAQRLVADVRAEPRYYLRRGAPRT